MHILVASHATQELSIGLVTCQEIRVGEDHWLSGVPPGTRRWSWEVQEISTAIPESPAGLKPGWLLGRAASSPPS